MPIRKARPSPAPTSVAPPADTLTIDESIARVQAGETAAFRGVVDALLVKVRCFVAARSVPGVDVDDIVQRTFVEAYQGIAGYRIGTNAQAWVLTIARYQLMMETTRLRRHADYHSRYVPVALADEIERRQTRGDDDESRLDHLRDCVSQLGDSARDVLRHRYEQDAPIAKIAARLQRSEGAIRKNLCVLRKQLHECILRKLASEQPS